MKIFDVKRKKADLSLSLNAIVILILAIAMLGLGLAFIRGIFKNIEVKVKEAVSAGEIQNPPNRDNPLTLTPSSIDLRQGESREVTVAFMNSLTSDYDCKMISDPALDPTLLSFNPPAGGGAPPGLLFSKGCYAMKKDQINLWTISVGTTGKAPATYATTYIYSVKIACYTHATPTVCSTGTEQGTFTKDLVISVTQ